MNAKDLVVGQVYFTLGFNDPTLHKPVITTYEYIEEATPEKGYFESGYRFKLLPQFWYYDDNGKRIPPEGDTFFFEPKKIQAMLTLSDLIAELSKISQPSSYEKEQE